jgi:hypothetical protein
MMPISGVFTVIATVACVGISGLSHARARNLEVDVVNSSVQPTYDFTLSADEIQSLDGAEMDSGNYVVRGLTSAEMDYKSEGSFYVYNLNSGRVRIEPNSIRVEIGYSHLAVYVDRDYAAGTCERAAVLEHENRHVWNALSTLQSALPAVRAAVVRAAAEPAQGGTVEQAKSAWMNRVAAAEEAAIAPFIAERQRLDNLLDSPESYARTQRQCE